MSTVNAGLCTLKCHLLDYMVKDLKISKTLSVFNNTPYEHFNRYIEQACRNTSQRRQTGMMYF